MSHGVGSSQGCGEMKFKGSRRSLSEMSCNELVRVEMQSFLEALASYPERFATDPRISFEQHRSSLAPAVAAVDEQVAPREKRARSAAACS